MRRHHVYVEEAPNPTQPQVDKRSLRNIAGSEWDEFSGGGPKERCWLYQLMEWIEGNIGSFIDDTLLCTQQAGDIIQKNVGNLGAGDQSGWTLNSHITRCSGLENRCHHQATHPIKMPCSYCWGVGRREMAVKRLQEISSGELYHRVKKGANGLFMLYFFKVQIVYDTQQWCQ